MTLGDSAAVAAVQVLDEVGAHELISGLTAATGRTSSGSSRRVSANRISNCTKARCRPALAGVVASGEHRAEPLKVPIPMTGRD